MCLRRSCRLFPTWVNKCLSFRVKSFNFLLEPRSKIDFTERSVLLLSESITLGVLVAFSNFFVAVLVELLLPTLGVRRLVEGTLQDKDVNADLARVALAEHEGLPKKLCLFLLFLFP